MTREQMRCRLAVVALGSPCWPRPRAWHRGRGRSSLPTQSPGVLAVLWNFVSGLFGETKNRGQMDPNGLTGTTADPGGEHRGQIDPNG